MEIIGHERFKKVKDLKDGHKYYPRNLEDIESVMLHRCGVDLKRKKPIEVRSATKVLEYYLREARSEKEYAQAVGGLPIPYTFLFEPARGGKKWSVVQTKPLGIITPHTRGTHNRYCLGIGVVGDWRVETLDNHSLCGLTKLIRRVFELTGAWYIEGHTERTLRKGTTSTPGKVCPGPGIDFNLIVQQLDASYWQKGIK